MGLFSKIAARKELNRLEDRYVSRKDRNVWRSDAQYVNGEYVYACRQEVTPPESRSKSKTASATSSRSSSRPSTYSSDSGNSSKSGSSRGSKRQSFTWGHMR